MECRKLPKRCAMGDLVLGMNSGKEDRFGVGFMEWRNWRLT
jgi:hypothetical protein